MGQDGIGDTVRLGEGTPGGEVNSPPDVRIQTFQTFQMVRMVRTFQTADGRAGSTWSPTLSVLRHSERTTASWVAQAARSGPLIGLAVALVEPSVADELHDLDVLGDGLLHLDQFVGHQPGKCLTYGSP